MLILIGNAEVLSQMYLNSAEVGVVSILEIPKMFVVSDF